MKNSTSLRFAVAAVFGVAAISAAIYFLSGNAEIAESSATPLRAAVTEQKTVSVDAINSDKQTPRELHKTSAMAKEFYASKDLRAFTELAKKRPQEGGMSYAYKAMAYCSNVQKMPSSLPYRPGEDSVAYGKRLNTFNQMKYRCQGFSVAELSDQAFGALEKDRIKQKDVLAVAEYLLLRKDGVPSTSQDDKKKFFKELSAEQDPVLINDNLTLAIYTNKKNETGYWFDGRFDVPAGSSDMVPVRDAMRLVGCKFGMACDSTNNEVSTVCVWRGACYDSLADYYKNTTYAKDEALFQQVLQLRDKMTLAIQQGETEKFFPPNSY